MSKFKIRIAVVNDAEGIAKVSTSSWKTTYKEILPQSFLDSLNSETKIEKWRSILEEDNEVSFIYVAVNKAEEIVGFCHFGKERTGNYPYEGELYALYLYKEVQGQGIGKGLVEFSVDKLNKSGIRNLMVWVLKDNPSSKFYQHLGARLIDKKQITVAGESFIEAAYAWESTESLLIRGEDG
ncbi:N-acetyltransferase family protein [Halobacillus andaensis]|uniref:GNAT family N-acetyltransferase n=1 Tax=Halobacillus andaensis TaxID=1176239 RepID=UPI003D7420E8